MTGRKINKLKYNLNPTNSLGSDWYFLNFVCKDIRTNISFLKNESKDIVKN